MSKTYIMSKEVLLDAIEKSINMSEASRRLNVPFVTFKGWAIKYGIYNPQPQSRKRLEEVKSNNIGLRVFRDGLKERICEECGIADQWNNKTLILVIHHKDGNRKNNNLNNLQVLCPNCHSQTENYVGKSNKKSPLP